MQYALNPDALTTYSDTRLAKETFALVDALQKREPKPEDLLAVAALLLLVAEQLSKDPRRLLETADRIMRDADTKYWRPEFRAIRDYLAKEVLR